MPPSPCGRNKVERDGEGGRGAHMEAVAVADIGPDAGRGQRVVVVAALRKKTTARANTKCLSVMFDYRISARGLRGGRTGFLLWQGPFPMRPTAV